MRAYVLLSLLTVLSAHHTAIVTNHAECGRVGRAIVHAPISHIFVALALCEGIVNPQDSGVGGGFQALVRQASGRAYHVNARERSPSDDSFLNDPLQFGNSVGVPSALHGYATILGLTKCAQRNVTHVECLRETVNDSHYGDIFTENLKLACDGFAVSDVLRRTYDLVPNLRRVMPYDDETGVARNPALCSLLRWLAESPANMLRPYYALNDRVRQIMLMETRAFGGRLRDSDFITYRTRVRRVDEHDLRAFDNYRAIVGGQPSSGMSALYFLQQRNLNYTYASLVRALRDTASTRIYFRESPPTGDSVRRMVVPLKHAIKYNATAHGVRRSFNRKLYPRVKVRRVAPPPENRKYSSTTNVVVIRGREAIVATSSINHLFGSTILSSRLGIAYNNQLRDFVPNSWRFCEGVVCTHSSRSAKTSSTPPSTMSPVMLIDKRTDNVVLGIGGTGGPKILPAVCNVVWHVLYGRKNIYDAIREHRLIVEMRAGDNETMILVEPGLREWAMSSVVPSSNVVARVESGYSSVTAASNFSGQCLASFGCFGVERRSYVQYDYVHDNSIDDDDEIDDHINNNPIDDDDDVHDNSVDDDNKIDDHINDSINDDDVRDNTIHDDDFRDNFIDYDDHYAKTNTNTQYITTYNIKHNNGQQYVNGRTIY